MRETLEDGTIRIRRYAAGDAGELYAAGRESIAEVGPWLPWLDESYTLADSESWIAARLAGWEAGDDYTFGVWECASGRFVGSAGLSQIRAKHGLANLGYWIRTSATGNGYAPRATALVARFGFEDLGLTRLEIICMVENLRSQRVAEKAGALREGVLRNRLVYDGEPCDAVMYSLIP